MTLTEETVSRIRAALHTQYVWAKTRWMQAGGKRATRKNKRAWQLAQVEMKAAEEACAEFRRAFP